MSVLVSGIVVVFQRIVVVIQRIVVVFQLIVIVIQRIVVHVIDFIDFILRKKTRVQRRSQRDAVHQSRPLENKLASPVAHENARPVRGRRQLEARSAFFFVPNVPPAAGARNLDTSRPRRVGRDPRAAHGRPVRQPHRAD